MLTTGGIFYSKEHEGLVSECSFEKLDFIRTTDDFYDIAVPNLTLKEMRKIDEYLPESDPSKIKKPEVPKGDIGKYSTLYRYYPSFAEAEI